MTRRILPLALLALMAAACGPTLPINAGLKEAGSNILFGRPPASPAPLPLQVPPLPNFPAPIELPPVPVFPLSPMPACAEASPLAFPALPATPSSTTPPAPATYKFRYAGSDTIDPGQADQKVRTVPGEGTREVANVSKADPIDGHFTYDVVETFAGWITTNSYEVYPTGPGPALSVNSPAAGIYLTNQTVKKVGATSPSGTFHPVPPVQIMAFPAQQSQTFQGGGTDPLNQAEMTVEPNQQNPKSGIVKDRARVNACGQVVDSWEADLAGTITNAYNSSGTANTYTLVLDFATQYGGISVSDHLTLDETDPASGKPETYEVTATIDEVPKPAQ